MTLEIGGQLWPKERQYGFTVSCPSIIRRRGNETCPSVISGGSRRGNVTCPYVIRGGVVSGGEI